MQFLLIFTIYSLQFLQVFLPPLGVVFYCWFHELEFFSNVIRMQASFEEPLIASRILEAEAFERDAMFIELRHEYGEDVPYTTFYGWCQTLKIQSGLVFYSADDVLSLLTLIWARFQKGYRSLDRQTIHKLRKGYANARANRATRATRLEGHRQAGASGDR